MPREPANRVPDEMDAADEIQGQARLTSAVRAAFLFLVLIPLPQIPVLLLGLRPHSRMAASISGCHESQRLVRSIWGEKRPGWQAALEDIENQVLAVHQSTLGSLQIRVRIASIAR